MVTGDKDAELLRITKLEKTLLSRRNKVEGTCR